MTHILNAKISCTIVCREENDEGSIDVSRIRIDDFSAVELLHYLSNGDYEAEDVTFVNGRSTSITEILGLVNSAMQAINRHFHDDLEGEHNSVMRRSGDNLDAKAQELLSVRKEASIRTFELATMISGLKPELATR